MCWRTRSRRTCPKGTLRVPVLRTSCFPSPWAEVLCRGKCVKGVNLEMEVNSDATFSVIGENQLSEWGSLLVLQPSPVKLWTFTGEVVEGLLQGAPMMALMA